MTGGRPVVFLLSLVFLAIILPIASGWADIEDNREDTSLYNIGIGISDATGPVAGVNMMGYANPTQIGSGIHMRLYSRAFIFDDGTRRLVFVNVDSGMIGQLTKKKVIAGLSRLYGSTYTFDNVILSGTHTHAGPGGFLQNLLFDITSLGFVPETLNAMVDGIVESIENAHNNIVPAYIYVSSGELISASINRSPTAYRNNPEEERSQYEYDTDKTMTVLRIMDTEGTDIGMINWFAVHPTSMNSSNSLVSSDNKGYAAQLFEAKMDSGSLPGQSKFVAAFANSNCGDASPNTEGARCLDTGIPCEIETSTCGGKVALCVAKGPGKDMMESTKIIGELQYEKAMELYNSAISVRLSGPIQYNEQLVDMPNLVVNLPSGEKVQLCKPALGYSFAAGTTDGPGALDFTQGMTEGSPFWNTIVGAIRQTDPAQMICHSPKPILLDTGNYNWPYPWHPRIMETHIGRIGSLFMSAVPGEFTTMSGRRMKNQIAGAAEAAGIVDPISVLAGYSNGYSHYITTKEEYLIQRYEGASTIFGPNTLQAYIQQYLFLLENMSKDRHPDEVAKPEDLSDVVMSLLPGVFYDTPEAGYVFGEVIAEPYPIAYIGETIIAKFASGHPRNDLMRGFSYLEIEKLGNDTDWTVIATDSNWDTRFEWESIAKLLGTSEATVYWDIPASTEEGTYRIRHYGASKSIFTGIIKNYEGLTNEFKVVRNQNISKETRIIPHTKRRSGNWLNTLFGMF